jgi:hypothetical protein
MPLRLAFILVTTLVVAQAHATTADDRNCTGCINTSDIKPEAFSWSKIKNSALGSAKVQDGQMRRNKLADNTFASSNLTPSLRNLINELQQKIASLEATVAAQDKLLAYFSVVLLPDPSTNSNNPTVRITGANFQVVNGTGTTGGAKNGVGNLIVGYNEADGRWVCSDPNYTNQASCEAHAETWSKSHFSGSHNIVVGNGQNYPGYGGLVAGYTNTVIGAYASVSGGSDNIAGGEHSSVSGGTSNTASGAQSSVLGGDGNTASGGQSSVLGGNSNTASGSDSSISGGFQNIATANQSSVLVRLCQIKSVYN